MQHIVLKNEREIEEIEEIKQEYVRQIDMIQKRYRNEIENLKVNLMEYKCIFVENIDNDR